MRQLVGVRTFLKLYLLNRVGQDLGHKSVILNRSAAEVKNLALDRRFVYCNARFFASLRFAQNDNGMIIWLPPNIEKIQQIVKSFRDSLNPCIYIPPCPPFANTFDVS